MTKGPEEKWGRPEATASLNQWGYGSNFGNYNVSPTLNIAGYLRGEGDSQPESGKADLLVCLRTKSGFPMALAVEVKGFIGSLSMDCLRDNQAEWAERMTWPYFIFLWGYEDDEIPDGGFRTKAAREKRHAYLVWSNDWFNAWARVSTIANVKTIRYRYTKYHRVALRENNLTIPALFGPHELIREGSIWGLPRNHLLAKQLAR